MYRRVRRVKVERVGNRWRVTRPGYGFTVADVTWRDSHADALALATQRPTEAEETGVRSWGMYSVSTSAAIGPLWRYTPTRIRA